MALFSDGPPSTIDDLLNQDSFLFSVSNTEGIDVSTKLTAAYFELEVELTAIFGREASIYSPVLGQAPLDTAHLAITPALKMWHSFKSLELVYRDAYFNQLNDRYKAKWAEYQNLGSWSRGKFIDTGAGLVIDPLPQVISPLLGLQSSASSGGIVYLSLTLVNAENEESTPTNAMQATIPDRQLLSISVPSWPSNAVGWNLYCGISPTTLTLQNPDPQILGSAFQLLLPPTINGTAPGTGQGANVTRDLPRRIMRG